MNVGKTVSRSLRLLSKAPSRLYVSQSIRAASQCTPGSSGSSQERPHFPCVDAHAVRESRIISSRSTPPSNPASSGPEPPYARPNPASYNVYHHTSPLPLVYADTLPSFDIAYETWGTLSPRKDNVILLHTGLSASSHAASTELNPADGWWEKFIGPGKALDTSQFFIICTNVLGGCYGSTGPSSPHPETGEPYATRFPILSIFDMVRAQFCLLDHLGIESLYASVGSSMGAMQSLAAGWLFPERVGKVVSISGTARSSPSAIAMRFAQRSVLMADPNWKDGFYYDSLPPHTGMKLARQIATITYRSGPEWDIRFGRQFRKLPDSEAQRPDAPRAPALCPDFLIETYLDHQGEEFCLKYDANSLIYISKAMDLFDLTAPALAELRLEIPAPRAGPPPPPPSLAAHPTSPAHQRYHHLLSHSRSHPPPPNPPVHLPDLAAGLRPLANTPVLVLGVQSDILFPVEQQREVADALRIAGNQMVSYYELGGVWGHDTFLLDVQNVGGAIRGFLS
ncbi:homoserine acetyltransferase [Dichomitus squalens LYAD-421 SS1]|uniref:Homoserine acetyltransferase n=1 Tax=Dichomitus squalens (strain LYAD-421) TaxID=732165 RepID=R7T263_DICSQ|nr:homoserine acetyltransferase [Dichomitus squalens LYAD-421 SS1]EJF62413.1 homoserine acetyltransferase [Dichomitus squalens LYAD-421 SS1]